jgi:hypothetical protein
MSKQQVKKVQARIEVLKEARTVSLNNARYARKAKFRRVSNARAARLLERIIKLKAKVAA